MEAGLGFWDWWESQATEQKDEDPAQYIIIIINVTIYQKGDTDQLRCGYIQE